MTDPAAPEPTGLTGPRPVDLGFGLRCRLRAKHARTLVHEIRAHGADQKLWWLFPVTALLILLALAVTTTTTALPVAVYALF
ncbi:MAG: hypothetical protein JWO77_134 [Ilumatobacteraceae bacterium]|nr:hypothetical protein [Ilumatobacteraceae bacterium]